MAGILGMTDAERAFLYLPLMHSEDAEVQAIACGCTRRIGVAD